MKKPLFASLILGTAWIMAPSPLILADDATPPSPTAPATGATTGAPGERGERWKAAFAQLDLTDAQKEQIKQIRASTSPGRKRRQQIMAVLTPDQKAKLISMFQQYRSEKPADGGAAATPGAN